MVGIKDLDMPKDCKSCEYKSKCFYDSMIDSYHLAYEGKKKNNCPLVEAISIADVVAMLEELKADIEMCVDGGEGSPQFEQGVDIARCQVVDMIQQKIDALKGDKY